jgi:hypothetical protein
MNKFSVIEVNDLRWSSIVNKSKQFDFITVNRIIYLKKEIAQFYFLAFLMMIL